jgi:hypothetical protein
MINNTKEINYPVLSESSDGSIFSAFVLRKEDLSNGGRIESFPAVCKFDNNGTLIWSRYLFNSNNQITNCWSRSIVEDANTIIAGFDLQECASSLCITGETYSLAIKMNATSGIPVNTQKYLFNGLPPSKGFLTNSGSAVIINGSIKNIIDFSSFLQLSAQTVIADDLQAIVFETDANLNLLQPKEIQLKGLRQNAFALDNINFSKTLQFNSDGLLLLGFKNFHKTGYGTSWVDTLRYYFSKITTDYSMVWQKKFTIYSPKNINQEPPAIIESSNCNTQIALTHISKFNTNNVERSFEVIRFNPQIKYNNACFGEDTSFIEVKPANVEQLPFFWSQQFTNILLPWNTTLTPEDIPVTKTELCRFENDCSNIKISGQDTVCTNDFFTFSATKNPKCYLPLKWEVPLQAADTIHISETVLSIKFKQAWQGTLYIRAGDCNTAVDSFTVAAFHKMPPCFTGERYHALQKPVCSTQGNRQL